MTRKNLKKFTCHYSENLIKYDIPIQKLWQVCLNYNYVTPPSIINKVSFADSNSIFQTNNYIPLRLPISLTNLGNTVKPALKTTCLIRPPAY